MSTVTDTASIMSAEAGQTIGKDATSEIDAMATPSVGTCDLDPTLIQRIFDFTRSDEFIDANAYALRARLELLEKRWQDFETVYHQRRVLQMHEQETQENNECFSIGKNAYFEAKAKLCQAIDAQKVGQAETGSLSDHNVVRQLGDILSQDKLPVFNGDFTQWATFRDLFRTEVHENPNFSKAGKLKKSLNALGGSAKRSIGDWRITDDQGYEDAWKALTRQYDNDYRTIRAHLQKIHELKPMRAASVEDMSEAFYAVRNARRNLQSMLTSDRLSDY